MQNEKYLELDALTGLYGVYGERTQRKSDDVSVEKARQYRCSVAGLQDFAFHT